MPASLDCTHEKPSKWKEKRSVSKPEVLNQFAPTTVQLLRREMAPLMQWVNLPGHLEDYKKKLFGLTIQPERLQQIRNERRPNSRYSSAQQVA